MFVSILSLSSLQEIRNSNILSLHRLSRLTRNLEIQDRFRLLRSFSLLLALHDERTLSLRLRLLRCLLRSRCGCLLLRLLVSLLSCLLLRSVSGE